MDTSRLGLFQLIVSTLGDPASGQFLIAEPDGADGAGRVTLFANSAAGSVYAEQTAGSLFVDMYHIIMFFGYYTINSNRNFHNIRLTASRLLIVNRHFTRNTVIKRRKEKEAAASYPPDHKDKEKNPKNLLDRKEKTFH